MGPIHEHTHTARMDAAMETVLRQCEVWTDNAP